MYCIQCGSEIPDGAQFCPKCGATQGRPKGVPPRPHGTSPQGPGPKKRWPLVVGICAAVLLVVAGIAAFTFVLRGPNVNIGQGNKDAGEQFDIVFVISIQGFDTNASRMPVAIKGTDTNGNEVNEVIYMAYEGVDTQLPAGSYQVSALGSPIAKDGTIYSYPNNSYSFKVSRDVAGFEVTDGRPTVTVSSVKALTYTPVDPSKMTDKAIDEALDWARKDTGCKADVSALEKAAKARKSKGSTNALWSSPRFFTETASRACTLQRFGNIALL